MKANAKLRRRHIPRIAILVDTSTSWGRRIHAGIHKYERKYGPWQLFVEPRGLEERLRIPSGWEGDGIIARVNNLSMAQELKALGIPIINVSGIHLPDADFPQVTSDLSASAQMAVRHFMDRGFRHFAYFSLVGLSYVAFHQQAFAQAITEVVAEELDALMNSLRPDLIMKIEGRVDAHQ